MKHRWWYAKVPTGQEIPDHPYIDMVLTERAPEKAVLSYQKYYDLGILTAFYMQNGEICEEDIDIFERDELERLQTEYDSFLTKQMLTYDNLIPEALQILPNFKREYDQLITEDMIDIDSGKHIFFGYAFTPLLSDALKKNDMKTATAMFSFLEKMADDSCNTRTAIL